MARRVRRSHVQIRQEDLLAETHDQRMLRRAKRFTRRGEHRQAMLSLREACQGCGESPRLWTMYAAACLRVRRRDDAKQALRQALWLRQRARDTTRATVMERLIERLDEHGTLELPLRAA